MSNASLTTTEQERIADIATEMVATRVLKGEVDPDDLLALRKATKEAVATARAAYFAALEYVSG